MMKTKAAVDLGGVTGIRNLIRNLPELPDIAIIPCLGAPAEPATAWTTPSPADDILVAQAQSDGGLLLTLNGKEHKATGRGAVILRQAAQEAAAGKGGIQYLAVKDNGEKNRAACKKAVNRALLGAKRIIRKRFIISKNSVNIDGKVDYRPL